MTRVQQDRPRLKPNEAICNRCGGRGEIRCKQCMRGHNGSDVCYACMDSGIETCDKCGGLGTTPITKLRKTR